MVDVEGLAISALDDRLGYIDRLKHILPKEIPNLFGTVV